MDNLSQDVKEIRHLLAELTGRVYRIEHAMGIDPVAQAEKAQAVAAPQRVEPPAAQNAVPASPQPHSTPSIPLATYPSATRGVDAASRDELESRIGSHWLNRIGISAVLIGVSYALKYAFDNNWIGSSGRVAIGLLAGIGVVLWSERFRSKGYKTFSYSLKALGIGVLYLSLWAAFQLYNLIPGSVAFGAMLCVTAATAALALMQDAEILAAFALAGGFTTPILLSTGENHETALFLYVALLDAATLVMVTLRPWRRLLPMSYFGTLLLYVGWYSRYYERAEFTATVSFATLFFLIFVAAPLLANAPKHEAGVFHSGLLALALINAGVYFFQVYAMMAAWNQADTAWVALGLALLYIVLSRQSSFSHSDAIFSERLRLLHLAIAVGFITIAIPIRLDTHWITIGWFIEAAALLWVGQRIESDLINGFALTALGLGVFRLLVLDNFHSEQLIFNARMGTHAIAIAVLGVVAWLASERDDDAGRSVAAFAIVALNVLALIALSREVSDYYSQQITNLPPRPRRWNPNATPYRDYRSIAIMRDFTYSALWMGYGAMLMVVGFWRKSAFVRWLALILIAITTVKVFVYDTSQLDHIYRILSFIVLGVLLLAVSFAYQRNWLQLSQDKRRMHQ